MSATARSYGSVNLSSVDSISLSVRAKAADSERIWAGALSSLVASMIILLMGSTVGFPSPVLLELRSLDDPERRFNSLFSGLFGASFLISGLLGAPIAGWVADKWGRKLSLILCAIPFLCGYCMVVSASFVDSANAFKALLLGGMLVAGIGSGWSFVTVPIYVGEIASASHRGLFSSLSEPFYAGGVLFVYSIGLIPTFRYYHIALVQEGVLLLYVLLVVWIPETPRWLLAKGKKDQAMEVMLFLRGPKAISKIQAEMHDIQASISETPRLTLVQTLKELSRRSVLFPFLQVVFFLMFLELCGGGTTVNTYAASIFKEAGVEKPDIIGAFALGGTQFIASTLAAFTVDFFGRKKLLLVSGIGMLAGSTMLGTHFYITRPILCANATNETFLQSDSTAVLTCNPQYAPLAIVSLVLFMVTFSVGWGPVPWVITSEYLPLQVKGVGTGIGVFANGISAVVVTGGYPIYAEYVNNWFAWWTFSIISLIGIVFTLVFVVETKGKSLEDIQIHFQQKYSRRKR